MSYNNSPVMPNKYLLPDGSITTFAGVEWAAADSDRADTYKQMQPQLGYSCTLNLTESLKTGSKERLI
jgi:hypothetical protein